MPAIQYPFIDIAVHRAVRDRFARGEALALFSPDLQQVLWANGAGADFFGTPSVYDFLDQGPPIQDVTFRQISAMGRQLKTAGDSRKLMVRISAGFRLVQVEAQVERLEIRPGEPVLLFSMPVAYADDATRAQALLRGFDDPDTHMALLDSKGRVIGASTNFDRLGISPRTAETIVDMVGRQSGGLMKRPIPTARGNLPAALGQIADAPAIFLLFAVETLLGTLDASDGFAVEPAADASAPPVAPAAPASAAVVAEVPAASEVFPSAEVLSAEPVSSLLEDHGSVDTDTATVKADSFEDVVDALGSINEWEPEPEALDDEPLLAVIADDEAGSDAVPANSEIADEDVTTSAVEAPVAQELPHAEHEVEQTHADTDSIEPTGVSSSADDQAGDVEAEQPEEPAAAEIDDTQGSVNASTADLLQDEALTETDFDHQVTDPETYVPDHDEPAASETVADDAQLEWPEAADEVPHSAETAVAEDVRPESRPVETDSVDRTQPGGGFAFSPSMRAARFVWKVDALGRFSEVSSEFARAVGPRSAAIEGETFSDLAALFNLDPEGKIADLLKKRDTWSGKTIYWPIEGTTLKVPVDLAALPTYTRNRDFDGFRGFGVVRLADCVEDPDKVGLTFLPATAEQQDDSAAVELEAVEETLEPRNFGDEASLAEEQPEEAATPTLEPKAGPQAEPPALVISRPAPIPETENIVQLKPRHVNREGLSPAEHATFREIARRLDALGLKSADAKPTVSDKADGEIAGVTPNTLTDAPEATSVVADVAGSDSVVEAADDRSEPAPQDLGDRQIASEDNGLAETVSAETATSPDHLDAGEDDSRALAHNEETSASEAVTAQEHAADEQDIASEQAGVAHPLEDHDNPEQHDASAAAPDLSLSEHEALETASADPLPEIEGHPTTAENDAEAHQDDQSADTDRVESSVNEGSQSEDLQTVENSDQDDHEVEAIAPATEILPVAPNVGVHLPRPPRDVVFSPEMLDMLPVALLAHRGDELIHANPEFLALTGYASVDHLAAAGGLEALLQRDDLVGEDDGQRRDGRLVVVRADDALLPVSARLQSIRWEEASALLLSLVPQADAKPVETEQQEKPADKIQPMLTLVSPVEQASEEAIRPAAIDQSDLRIEVEELRSILETATDGVVTLNVEGEIRTMNGAASALFNYDEDDLRGKPFVTLFAHESQRAILDYLSGLTGHGVASVLNDGREVIGRESSGGFIPLFMTIGRLSSSNGFCAVIRDITQWKRTEEELRSAKRAAETANAHKTDFLARVSHEIRTPLNAIIGFADIMADERFGPIGHGRYAEYAADIGRSGRHVLDIVNDLLDISKIEAGEMDLEFIAVGLNETVCEAVAIVQPQANGQRVIIRTALSQAVPNVVADMRSIKQIVLNILSNAIRFTPSGGQIIVSTNYEANGSVTLRIRDTGIGMTRAELEQAMKPFRQVSPGGARLRGDGTGLGLPLTKAMVDANRASFSIQSTPNEGTLVEISFPSPRVLAG
ncbi:ATP-binding protein [Allorhizobium taibaishanense]|uniref:histidine kinase n=1 Tax=Allorhizobium taibaishanense TaxID=887144 RepID=A0A7W6HRM2_9HYPH|nr:ATP-binding protein [Allorhizobium taibaishanense]MBB4010164.1 PAS domain S-box-containing protein [Allorhizobium taibaishanense]